MRFRIYLSYLLLLCMACHSPVQRKVTPAFYFWKQTWTGNTTEKQYVAQLPAKRLYIKMFDVELDDATQTPAPVATFRQAAPLSDSVDIIPVVFLMNNIWEKADTTLAGNVGKLLQQLCEQIPAARIPEIQLDCDWTKNSRTAYFDFLTRIRQHPFFRNRSLSVTIRMHQVKFLTASGTPPADKGLLMCYNMGDLRKYGDHNSILDETTMAAYIGKDRVARYPLPLDLALPLFEWSVLFRKGQYAGILRNISTQELRNTRLFDHSGQLLYTVKQDTLLNGYALRQGEVVRRETTSHEALKAAARLVAQQRQTYDPVVIFFHLDSVTLHNYPLDELQKIYRLFN
ncbi:hypothetical protein [Chitinophaga nivalis]|uniref:Uncharacterized protein n=1 Tax=Chitinophaga nivalis TaxID=2991709 RepID=A0ABT3IF59_9BACT|nr:hypothetical protein [Chitinophaga nivalis]MCW3467715.1 hypothetical protein [Chitinophaga nivalis]MCW3482593.1 hypothetical protein [Chitinophaga nivalis]